MRSCLYTELLHAYTTSVIVQAVTTVDASVEQVSGEWIQVYGSDDGYDCIHRRMSTISVTDGNTRIITDHQMG